MKLIDNPPELWSTMTENRTVVKISSQSQTVGPNFHQVQLRVVLIPILSCIFCFPVLVLLIICGLRFRAKRARKLASKRLERPIALEKGPAIVINDCGEDANLSKNIDSLSDRGKLRFLSVRFKPLADLDEERSYADLELTSDFILTPEDSSNTFSSS